MEDLKELHLRKMHCINQIKANVNTSNWHAIVDEAMDLIAIDAQIEVWEYFAEKEPEPDTNER